MPIKKTYRDTFQIELPREEIFALCEHGLADDHFKQFETDRTLGQLRANYRRMPNTYGDVTATLMSAGNSTQVDVQVRAGVDNIYALFKSPGQTILQAFHAALTAAVRPNGAASPVNEAGTGTRPREAGRAEIGSRDAATQSTSATATKPCPDCAETVLAGARKCKYCGFRFDDSAAIDSST